MYHYWNPTYATAAQNHDVVLWYWQGFYDASTYDSSTGEYGTHYSAYIDATNGQVIAVSVPIGSIAAPKPGPPTSRPQPRAWPRATPARWARA